MQSQATYNYKVVRQFAVMTVIWGIVGMLVGVIIAAQLVWPELNFFEWLSYGRLRPLHTNAVIFAFGGCALFATSYYSVQRTCHTPLFAPGIAAFTFWGWQLVIVLAALSLPLGFTSGKEYAELEWPIDILITVVWVAYAVVFFKFPGRMVFFWMIFITLMLPVEVRILPTYQVVTDLKLINSYAGLTLPIIASATATLLFRQFFLTIPDELVEAAKIDGAGPLRFFKDVVIPLSRTNIAALFVILFIYGWNQYLWPLLITTSNSLDVIVVAIKKMIGTGAEPTDWHIVMSTTMLALIPPVLVIILMQKSFVKGLTDTEK